MQTICLTDTHLIAAGNLSPGSAGALAGTGLTFMGGAFIAAAPSAGLAVSAVGLAAAGPVLLVGVGAALVGYGIYEVFN